MSDKINLAWKVLGEGRTGWLGPIGGVRDDYHVVRHWLMQDYQQPMNCSI